eukprot:SAG31_NODE_45815_length_257_cov_0.658228_1_plen_32_part_01
MVVAIDLSDYTFRQYLQIEILSLLRVRTIQPF